MKRLRYILYLLTGILTMTACTDDLTDGTTPSGGDKGTGEMVLFAAGTTAVSTSSRADGKTYYMPDTYRFVCRMYYKAATGENPVFDVSGNTDQTTWMKVDGNIGNSLYWNMGYADVDTSIKGRGGVDEYGNDYSATAFYWQNRKEHAFLAWTDLNKATSMVGGDAAGQLKFQPADYTYRIYSNEVIQAWDLKYFEIYGVDMTFANQEEMEAYVREHGKDDAFTTAQSQLETGKGWKWNAEMYYYRHGKQYKWSRQHVEQCNVTDDSYDNQWFQEFMYFETLPYNPDNTETEEYSTEPGMGDVIAYLRKNGVRVAKAELKVNSDGKPIDSEGSETTDPNKYIYTYAQTDSYGNLIYNESHPEYTFYFSTHYVKQERKKYDDYPCNRFDLTRGDKSNMAQQPDIAQAKTLQAPSGATQEANRVNLYFKHQFSQVQVNVKNAADNSVTLSAGDIQKVELLGVTDEGYVFTDLDEDGNVHAAAYKEIEFSKYNEEQLKDNPYGTAFQMFDIPEEETAPGYLKSFNCITFGQLQAIRITWQETGDGHTSHKSTYRIPNTELVNLKSGMRYIWNIEVRRGTLAIIRTEIVDWELPEGEEHNGSTDGIIND